MARTIHSPPWAAPQEQDRETTSGSCTTWPRTSACPRTWRLEHPDILAKLQQDLFLGEAVKYQVLPHRRPPSIELFESPGFAGTARPDVRPQDV